MSYGNNLLSRVKFVPMDIEIIENQEELNDLIINKIEDIDDKSIARFVGDLLNAERKKLDNDWWKFRDDYQNALETHFLDDWQPDDLDSGPEDDA